MDMQDERYEGRPIEAQFVGQLSADQAKVSCQSREGASWTTEGRGVWQDPQRLCCLAQQLLQLVH